MKIQEYRYLGNSKYKVIINNNEYILYEDIILKYDLLLKNINEKDLTKFLEENKKYEAYYVALKYIKTKLRTKKEIEEYLSKKDYNDLDIDYTVARLTQEKYLDEKTYAKSYISDAINLKNIGPNKIVMELTNLGIDKNIILEELTIFTNYLEKEKIYKYIDKNIKNNHNKSSYILKNKIKQNLINLGYDLTIINKCLSEYNINDNEIYQKELAKAKNKLSKKYTGKELEYKIKEYMYRKGFNKE
jgi:regulatory protein